MRRKLARDVEIARLAARQGGVVARSQLALSPAAIDRRLRAGRLHRLHRGVYAVGHPAVGRHGARWAAVLALGRGAVLSHGSAGAAYALLAAPSTIHVTVPGRGGRARRAGLVVHRPEILMADEVSSLRGLPITTPARTLLDVAAGGLQRARLAEAVDRAEQLRLLDFAQLHAILARHEGRPGTGAVKAVLAAYTGPADVRSHLERLLLELCAAHALPRPVVNTVIEGSVRDFAWPSRRLVVEADSYAWHRSPAALNADRARDVALTLAGWRVLRFTYAQITRRRRWVTGALVAALRAT